MTRTGVAPRSAASDRALAVALGAGLVAAVAVIYGRVLGHEFVSFDDDRYVYANPQVLGGLSGAGLRWAFSGFHLANYHPLTWLSYMVDVQLWGADAGALAATNALLHAATAVVLFAALRSMTGASWRSALVAALFAVHPLRVESVAWVSGRKDVLSGLFAMLTLLAYVHYARRPGPWRYLPVFGALAGGLLAKPTLVPLPLLLLLLDYWPLGRWRGAEGGGATPRFAPASAGALVVEKLPLAVLSIGCGIATVLAQRDEGTVVSMGGVSPALRVANALVSYVAYLGKTLWPVDLAFFYPHPAARFDDPLAELAGPATLAAVVLVGLTWGALWVGRRRRYLAVGWLWYAVALAPVSGLFQAGDQALADRYGYLPLIGVTWAAVWGLADWTARRARWRRVALRGAPVALVLLSAASWQQVGTWRDSETLYRHALRVTRDNYVVYNNLGAILERRGEHAAAVEQFERALQVRPRYSLAHNNLANTLVELGDLPGAVRHYEAALRADPRRADVWTNLGIALLRQGELDRAAASFQRALAEAPDHVGALTNLGVVHHARGELDRAAAWFERALAVAPDDAFAHNNLGVVLEARGDLAGAATHYGRAAQLLPTSHEAHANLGRVLVGLGDLEGASLHLERALDLKPGYAPALAARERLRARRAGSG